MKKMIKLSCLLLMFAASAHGMDGDFKPLVVSKKQITIDVVSAGNQANESQASSNIDKPVLLLLSQQSP